MKHSLCTEIKSNQSVCKIRCAQSLSTQRGQQASASHLVVSSGNLVYKQVYEQLHSPGMWVNSKYIYVRMPRFQTNLHNSCTELRRAGRARQEINQWNGVEDLVGFQNKTNPVQNRQQNQKKRLKPFNGIAHSPMEESRISRKRDKINTTELINNFRPPRGPDQYYHNIHNLRRYIASYHNYNMIIT